MVLCFSSTGLSHEKYEKESRIKATDGPESPVAFFDSLVCKRKTKWYRETGVERTSIQAIARWQDKRICIDFSADGVFEDVEIRISTEEIEADAIQRISDFLKDNYENTPSTRFNGSISDQPVPCSPIFTKKKCREARDKQ